MYTLTVMPGHQMVRVPGGELQVPGEELRVTGVGRRGTYHAVCRTDMSTVCRYLDDAAAFYERHAAGTREKDRARLLRNMSKKLKLKY